MKEKRKDQTWKNYLRENLEEITIKMARFYLENYGTEHQIDLYLWEDGTWTEFSNPGGNSWLSNNDLDHVIPLSTTAYDYHCLTEQGCKAYLKMEDSRLYTTSIADLCQKSLRLLIDILER